MIAVHPSKQAYLQDAFGSPFGEGSCVVLRERQAGYVRLAGGARCFGPHRDHADRCFSVIRTRPGEPLRGEVRNGQFVQIRSGARS